MGKFSLFTIIHDSGGVRYIETVVKPDGELMPDMEHCRRVAYGLSRAHCDALARGITAFHKAESAGAEIPPMDALKAAIVILTITMDMPRRRARTVVEGLGYGLESYWLDFAVGQAVATGIDINGLLDWIRKESR